MDGNAIFDCIQRWYKTRLFKIGVHFFAFSSIKITMIAKNKIIVIAQAILNTLIFHYALSDYASERKERTLLERFLFAKQDEITWQSINKFILWRRSKDLCDYSYHYGSKFLNFFFFFSFFNIIIHWLVVLVYIYIYMVISLCAMRLTFSNTFHVNVLNK